MNEILSVMNENDRRANRAQEALSK
jgi:hypothetical protein